MLVLWYNGISASHTRARAAILSQRNGFVNRQIAQKLERSVLSNFTDDCPVNATITESQMHLHFIGK